jgi:hypothetical protein
VPRKLRTIGFPSAPQVHCLASPTPRTPWTNFRIGRTDAAPPFWGFVAFTPVQSVTRWFHVFSPPVRGAFQLSLTLLLCYRFLGVFRVRGSCPRSSDGISNPPYSLLRHHPRHSITGLSPSTAPCSKGLQVWTVGWTRAPHLHAVDPHGFGLPSSVFDRLYSRNHDCFLFLCLLRCFNSAGYLSHEASSLAAKRSHSAIPGSSAPCAYPG